MSEIQNNQDTSVNASVSSVLGVWQNLQIILGQQASRYIQAINEEIKAKRRKVSISDINGLLSFLENSINNTLSVSLKQQITITKLNTTQRMGKIPNGKNVDNNNKINENGNMKQTIRLNERELKHLIKESVKRVLREGKYTNNIVPRRGEDFVDNDGNVKSIAQDPFYDEYSSKDAKEKRLSRQINNIDTRDSRLWLDGGWNDDTIETAIDRLKNHPEQLELSPSEIQAGAVQRCGDPTNMGGRRIAANNMWELWDIDGEPCYILRKDWVKKHEMELWGDSNENDHVSAMKDIYQHYGMNEAISRAIHKLLR